MGGWHLRMTRGQEVCYASFQWTPASALSLPTVWSHRGNPGVTRCREMVTLPAGYIPQCKMTLRYWQSVEGHWVSLCVWSDVGWLIVYQIGDYLYLGRHSQTISGHRRWMILPWGREYSSTFLGSRSWLENKQTLIFIDLSLVISTWYQIQLIWDHWRYNSITKMKQVCNFCIRSKWILRLKCL